MFCLEVLNDFCTSVSFGKLVFSNHRPLCPVKKSGVRKTSLVEENCIRQILSNLNVHKPMMPDRKHPQVLWELIDVIVWLSEEVLKDWKKANTTHIQEGQEERSRNLHVDQLHIHHWDGDGTSSTGNYFQKYERQENYQE